jgi:hypothetical protein
MVVNIINWQALIKFADENILIKVCTRNKFEMKFSTCYEMKLLKRSGFKYKCKLLSQNFYHYSEISRCQLDSHLSQHRIRMNISLILMI